MPATILQGSIDALMALKLSWKIGECQLGEVDGGKREEEREEEEEKY